MAANNVPNQASPYFLHSSDQPGQLLVTQLLDGDNYPTWSRAITMALEAKNKLGFIDGTILKPEPNNPNFSNWVRCNSMVQSWHVHSTIPTIANSILWIKSARDIWFDLLTRFNQKNAPRIFEIRRAISNLSQGTSSIAAYYTQLKAYRDELDSYRTVPTCVCGVIPNFNDTYATEHLMDFLQGLNDSFASVRSQILLMDPLPSVTKAYSLFLQEERQRSLSDSRSITLEQSAMPAQHNTTSRDGNNKPIYYCSHCDIEGHSDSRCYEKIGYPSWWKHNLGPNKNRRGTSSRGGRGSRSAVSRNHPTVAAVASPSESQPPVHLSQSQINQLLSLLKITGPDDEEDFCDG
ncbi:unnamed protein product [Trifolium pratense]|uniref:Uncharacterized protein n=1 Tax=Trifolium pratense TaxID=57577 RepID=A0ACB0K8J2_TRIPR|nr:unnamed protein product [Trifolium pratense]